MFIDDRSLQKMTKNGKNLLLPRNQQGPSQNLANFVVKEQGISRKKQIERKQDSGFFFSGSFWWQNLCEWLRKFVSGASLLLE